MKKAKIFGDKNLTIGEIDRNLYSSFLEHLGRAVYEGIYEPGHPAADAAGFRRDTLELIRELNVPVVRYPGGNFVSGYRWEDGVGPKKDRPRRLDLAWQTLETNEFGTDEFMDWSRLAGVEPMMAVNLGTGTPQTAADLVEYCNFRGGTSLSDRRAANGHKESYGVKYWCLGNEMDGPWQICHLSAEDYAKKALEAAKMMKWIDPEISLVACGSAGQDMPTFPEWDRVVLETLYPQVEYLSVHQYYWWQGDDNDFYASYKRMDNYIKSIKATLEYVRTKLRTDKKVYISFDEWNVWYQNAQTRFDWIPAPHILEDVYSLQDAVVFGGLMNTLLNNCDVVKMACLAQLVNVIAPIMTERGGKAIRQTIFYPFRYVSNYGKGKALRLIGEGDSFESAHGAAEYVSAAVTYDESEICVFCCNYAEEEAELALELRSFGTLAPLEHVALYGGDKLAKNTLAEPNAVTPRRQPEPSVTGDRIRATLPALSWNMIRFGYGGKKA